MSRDWASLPLAAVTRIAAKVAPAFGPLARPPLPGHAYAPLPDDGAAEPRWFVPSGRGDDNRHRERPPPRAADPRIAEAKDIAAMRLTCRAWAAPVALAVQQPLAWHDAREIAEAPPQRAWAHVRGLCVRLSAQDRVDDEAVAAMEARLRARYASLAVVHWQADGVGAALNARLAWDIVTKRVAWRRRARAPGASPDDEDGQAAEDSDDVDAYNECDAARHAAVPAVLRGSVVCGASCIEVQANCRRGEDRMYLLIDGPVTTRQLIDRVNATIRGYACAYGASVLDFLGDQARVVRIELPRDRLARRASVGEADRIGDAYASSRGRAPGRDADRVAFSGRVREADRVELEVALYGQV